MVKICTNTQCMLGEGIAWHRQSQSLLWVDIKSHTVYRLTRNKEILQWRIPEFPSAIIPRGNSNNTVWLLTRQGLQELNIESGTVECALEFSLDHDLRTNDAGVDCFGTLWVGVMHNINPADNIGFVFTLDELGQKNNNMSMHIPNTFCRSLAGNQMFVTDSLQRTIYAISCGQEMSETDSWEVLYQTEKGETPDGGTIDENGNLWVAIWGGGRVDCISPTGKRLTSLHVPAPNVTNCCFGGENGSQLFITTAREGLTAMEMEDYPQSGSVFVADVDVRGLPTGHYSPVHFHRDHPKNR